MSFVCKGKFIRGEINHVHHFFVNLFIEFLKHNLSIQEDLYYPHPLIQDLIWDSCYVLTEPLLTRWPFNKLRQKALEVTMKHIHYEDENSRYITIGCVEKVKQNSTSGIAQHYSIHI